ncbi:unnamed protein product, partial [Lymnaea stagnalis]
ESYLKFDSINQMYGCQSCGKKYKSSAGARLHYRIKHCGLFDHYCSMCGKGFQQKSHLKSHMSLHIQQKDFECNICGSKYAHKTSLTAHQKLAHGSDAHALPFSCSICGQGYFSTCAMRLHKQTHLVGRQHICEICGFKFLHKHHLKRHEKNIHK